MFGPNVSKVLKRNFWIITIAWCIVACVALLELECGIDLTSIIEIKNINHQITYEFFKDFGILYIISVFLIIVFWIANNFAMKKVGYGEEENYYRDLMKENTPSEISYIDNQFLETKKDIISTVLMLKVKDKIEFVDNKIKVKEDINNSGLKKSEICVLEYLKNKHYVFHAKYDLRKAVIEELEESGVIKRIEPNVELASPFFTPRFMFEWLGWVFYGIIIQFMGYFNVFNSNILNKIIECLGVIPYGVVAYLVIGFCVWNAHFTLFSYGLTKKGEEIKSKINGLRLFLRDYSDMKNKSLREIEIWDEYMVYSVVFNDNKRIQKEVLRMLKK